MNPAPPVTKRASSINVALPVEIPHRVEKRVLDLLEVFLQENWQRPSWRENRHGFLNETGYPRGKLRPKIARTMAVLTISKHFMKIPGIGPSSHGLRCHLKPYQGVETPGKWVLLDQQHRVAGLNS
jgi:hypothetical protein